MNSRFSGCSSPRRVTRPETSSRLADSDATGLGSNSEVCSHEGSPLLVHQPTNSSTWLVERGTRPTRPLALAISLRPNINFVNQFSTFWLFKPLHENISLFQKRESGVCLRPSRCL